MVDEIRQAVIDAVRRLHVDATDVSTPDDLTPLLHDQPASITVTWKSDQELHLGNFSAWARPTEESSREIAVLKALDLMEVPVPRLVTTGTAGEMSVLLAHQFEGNQMSQALNKAGMRWEISATAFTYARMLARIHALDWTKVMPWIEDPESVPEDIIDNQVEEEFAERHRKLERVPHEWTAFIKRVIEWRDLRRPVEVSLCICHGQFRPENIYAVGEDITEIANWQHARVTDASYDLAMLPVWLSDIGLTPEEAELFAQAAHGAYLQASPRGLGNLPYYSVARPLDQLLEQLIRRDEPEPEAVLEATKGTIERAMALAGRVPWKNR
jgi:aminoglycoside phosphotransferase (APT) family kinase protein